MRHPTLALLWRCWRLTQRWYVLILMIAVVLHLAIMNLSAPRNIPSGVPFRELMGNLAFVVNFSLAVFTTLFTITVGGRSGFPLGFEFRLPVNMKLLVAVPMLYLAAACASLYLIPALLSRLFYDIPFPLAPAAALLATVVIVLAACSWSTTGNSTRALAFLAGGAGLLQLVHYMQSLNLNFANTYKPGARIFNANVVSLTWQQYGVLLLVCLLMFAITVYRVGMQRRGDDWRLLKALAPRKAAATTTTAPTSAPARQHLTLIERVQDLLTVPCPTSSPWRAELWFELKRYGMPVLALGLVLALVVPVILLIARGSGWNEVESPVWVPAAAVFFIGIGIAFFNRRVGSGGYMNAFEGTRGLGTLQLAAAQLLVSATTTLLGMLLTVVSWWLCLSLVQSPGVAGERLQSVLALIGAASWPVQLGDMVVLVTLYLASITLFTNVHSCSVFWGRKVLYGMMAFTFYCIVFTFLVSNGASAGDAEATHHRIQQHMWGFAGLILLLTLSVLARVLYLKLLSLPTGITALAAWLVFLVCAWISLQSLGVNLLEQARELQAFNSALLLLPLTLFLLTIWSYDKLRHR